MLRKSLTFIICLLLSVYSYGQSVNVTVNQETGALRAISIDGDATGMNWILGTDEEQNKWFCPDSGWGLGYFTVNGKENHRWSKPVTMDASKTVYREGDVEITVKRSHDGDDLVETFTFKNVGSKGLSLSDIGVFTPFNDNYPDAKTCMESRCHAHIWEGADGAYVNLLRMGARGPHLGLVVTEGAISGYDIFERNRMTQSSNARGVIALRLPDMSLEPGKSYDLAWRLFPHDGADFKKELLLRGGVYASADRYAIEKGGKVIITLEGAEGPVSLKVGDRNVALRHGHGAYRAKVRLDEAGSCRFEFSYGEGKRTWGEILVVNSEKQLIAKRADFIIGKQQMNDPSDPRYGAFLVYDNELDEMFLNDRPTCSYFDRGEGGERLAMGMFLAKEAIMSGDPKFIEPLERYASYIRKQLQTDDFETYQVVGCQGRNRGYNYHWVAVFYFEMYNLTGDRKYAEYGYRTMKSFYDQFGYSYYGVHTPVSLGLQVLKKAGMSAEHDALLSEYRKMGDAFVETGLNYPKHEVNYEQHIVAPAISFLCQLYLATHDLKYLDEARIRMPLLEAFGGDQPTYFKNDMSIRHWDAYWLGKREMWGDNFPHWGSTTTAEAYYFYTKCTGEKQWQARAERIVRNNLCQFDEEGRGYCAYVYPDHVNGVPAKFFDPYANDQDFALALYHLVINDIL